MYPDSKYYLNDLHYRRCMFFFCDISNLAPMQVGTLDLTDLHSYL